MRPVKEQAVMKLQSAFRGFHVRRALQVRGWDNKVRIAQNSTASSRDTLRTAATSASERQTILLHVQKKGGEALPNTP